MGNDWLFLWSLGTSRDQCLYAVLGWMLWAWKDKIMREKLPFSSLVLISRDAVIIAVLLLILCVWDAQKELPRVDP